MVGVTAYKGEVTLSDSGELCITRKQYDEFLALYPRSYLRTVRLGQAFYTYFRLGTVKGNHRECFAHLWKTDGEDTQNFIEVAFNIIS